MRQGAEAAGVRLRGHHLLCLLSFSGEGYSPAFVQRFRELAAAYRSPQTVVSLLESPDDACAACPYLEAEGCRSPADGPEKNVAALDAAVLSRLGVAAGEHRAGDLHARVADLSEADLHGLCRACSWWGKTDCQKLIREEARRLSGLRRD